MKLDNQSTGFLYCVSVTGTTGVRDGFDNTIIRNLKNTYQIVNNNKMLIGFGISKPEDIKQLSPFADGFIVGSAIIKSLKNDEIDSTVKLVKSLSEACRK